MPGCDIGRDVIQGDPAGGAGKPGEVFVEHLLGDADSLEQLRTGVGGQRRDAHLRHHFQHTLTCGFDVVVQRRRTVDALDNTAVEHVLDRLEHQVGVDRGRAESDQRGHVVHLAGITGLDHQTHLGAGPFPNQVVVHSRNGEQRRYRSHFLVGLAVGQDDDPSAVGDCRRRRATYLFQRGSQPSTSLGDPVQTANHLGPQSVWAPIDLVVGIEADQLGELVVTQNRLGQHDLVAGVLVRLSKSRSPPVVPCRLVTTSSRMASNGGLVTWANS